MGLPTPKAMATFQLLTAGEFDALEANNEGICAVCGAISGGCEIDAVDCECAACGEFAVHGVLELLLWGFYAPRR